MLPVKVDICLRERCLRTFLLYTGFLSLGMCFSVVGPTLQDLAFRLGTNTADMSTIYTARSSGLILGSLIGGVLLERFHRVCVVGSSYVLSGVFTALLPWCTSLGVLIVVMLANGVSMGMVDTGSTVWCLDMWTSNPGPFVHALHFFFGIGTFVAPLIAERFLIPSEITSLSRNRSTLASSSPDTLNATLAPADFGTIRYEGYYEEISYGIIGVVMTLIGVATLLVSAINPSDSKRLPEDHHSSAQPQTLSRRVLVAVIVLLVLLHFLIYGGIEIAYGQLIATYAVILPHGERFTKSAASFLTSAFWGAFMVGRGASIFINHFVTNFTLIVVDHVIIVLSCAGLWLFAEESTLVLWIATSTFGFGMSAVYPAIYGWVNTKIYVSNRTGGFFAIGTAAGEMLVPFLVGQFIEARPQFIMESTAVCGALMTVLFLALVLVVSRLEGNK